MHFISISGVRPNFVKIAPVAHAFQAAGNGQHSIIHTGQHYDDEMAGSFIRVLNMPAPEVTLDVGTARHGTQMSQIMEVLEPELVRLKPDWLLIYGDDNSTTAAAILAGKTGIRTAHIEAGLRVHAFDQPDEANRRIADDASELLFVTEPSAIRNLVEEGVPEERIHHVGNVMIDTLIALLPQAKAGKAWEHFNLDENGYVLSTIHYPFNVDNESALRGLVGSLVEVSRSIPVVFPVHPRTRSRLRQWDLWNSMANSDRIILTEPLDYLTFLSIEQGAVATITDSGGIQDECTYLGVPCLTIRPHTERPITVEIGTNELVAARTESITEALQRVLSGSWKKGRIPELWDGQAAERIVRILLAQH